MSDGDLFGNWRKWRKTCPSVPREAVPQWSLGRQALHHRRSSDSRLAAESWLRRTFESEGGGSCGQRRQRRSFDAGGTIGSAGLQPQLRRVIEPPLRSTQASARAMPGSRRVTVGFVVIPSLCFIINLQPSAREIETTLQNGKVVTLPKSRESYEYFSSLLIRALERRHPVGLRISDDGDILAVERADNDLVEKIVSKDQETLTVQFQGHDGFFSLERNHPSFDRVYTALERSRMNSQRVWFVAGPRLGIFDVIPTEESRSP